ncbi:Kinesin-4 [Platanthera zijinensis]|uniref:Kinesin-4 n=1 Tax=Platanthera zijinensis TaxID=2320716 RepID=A0AAP0GF53_9ASPA
MAGPLGLPAQPTEQEFVSCLKSGLVLCNAINKIQSGAVPKVITNQSAGLSWENQTLTAYQYFENIRNFLVAVDELKIPSFEISDIERAGSVGNIVDCILGLKAYHEWKQSSKSNGPWKYLSGNIQVYCRVRPAFGTEVKCSIDYIGNDGALIILDPLKSQLRKNFQFNKVFGPNVTQEEVYKETQSLIRSVMDGYNVCIFAYGQTGSGKTYSMCGPAIGSAKDIGINSMALNDLFQISCTREDIKYEIHVQMVEIYNEQILLDLYHFLLLNQFVSFTNFTLEIRNCLSNGGLSLPDATMHHVVSTSDVVNLMKIGDRNRAFSCTAMNNRSSRSHSVVTIHVCGRDVLGNKLQSCLHLVDLAGSERVDKSEVTGDRMKEAQHINKSLSCLGDVISALAQKSSHIPYRNSKLTLLLQNSLGGHSKMLMLAHVSPEAESYGETISTLKFAQRVSTVELGVAHVNKESVEIRDLREQVFCSSFCT